MTATVHRRFDGPPRIAVLGGGMSGLAAAHRLTELVPRAELAVLEASARLGGVLETVQRDGFLIERSADSFLTSRPEGVALCERLGLADQLLPTDEKRRRALVVHRGRLLPIPAGFYLMSPRKLGSLLRSPVLSVRGKLRLLAEPLVRRRGSREQGAGSREQVVGSQEQGVRSREQDPKELHAPCSPLSALDDESVAAFARRRLGREVFDRLVQPLVAGIYTADAAKLSMAATMPDFLAMERDYGSLLRATIGLRRTGHSSDQSSGARYGLFVAPKDGMESLVTALAKRLPIGAVRLGMPAVSLRPQQDGRWQVGLGRRGATEPFDAVIIALPAHAAARVLEPCDVELAAELAAIPYAGCAVVSSAYRRGQIAHSLDGFGFVVPQIEGRRIIAGSFASNKFPGRAPRDAVLIRVFVGGSLQPELAELPDADLRSLVREELADLLTVSGEPLWIDVTRWPRSMPQYHVGHLTRVARIEQHAARWPGLALAGNAYHGVGIPQCIASGEAAAERVAARCGLVR